MSVVIVVCETCGVDVVVDDEIMVVMCVVACVVRAMCMYVHAHAWLCEGKKKNEKKNNTKNNGSRQGKYTINTLLHVLS